MSISGGFSLCRPLGYQSAGFPEKVKNTKNVSQVSQNSPRDLLTVLTSFINKLVALTVTMPRFLMNALQQMNQ